MEWNEEKWNKDINDLYRKLIKLKKEEEVLRSGSFKFLSDNEDFVSYARFNLDEAIVFVNSKKNRELEIDLSSIGSFVNSKILVGNSNYEIKNNKLFVSLNEKESLLLKLY